MADIDTSFCIASAGCQQLTVCGEPSHQSVLMSTDEIHISLEGNVHMY